LTAFVDAVERGLRRLPGPFTKCLKIDILCVAGDAKGYTTYEHFFKAQPQIFRVV
uniref:RT_RNaseH_2 domain-containing protein n=1 Tax=Angiostrongylus cantonensis TaxID=6313 RepID=A0A0K0DJD3_ANGCA